MMSRARRLRGFAVALLLGCNSGTLEVGSNDGGAKVVSPEGSTASTPVVTVNGVDASALIGTWDGYVESFQFQSGSDAVVLAVSGPRRQRPGRNGHLRQRLPAASRDRWRTWGIHPGVSQLALATAANLWEGFIYTAIDLTFDGTRLQLGAAEGELWKGWCPLLTVYGQGPDGGGPPYGCLPNWGFQEDPLPDASDCSRPDPLTGQNVPVDCGKLDLCAVGASVCTCSASGCVCRLDHARTDPRYAAWHQSARRKHRALRRRPQR